jgi:hypothetical protein
MKLDIKGFAITMGVLWAAAIFLVGLGQLMWPGYGLAFLEFAASLYPGFEIGGFGSLIVGTGYGLVDGLIGGAVFAWLYNRLIGGARQAA